MLRHLVAALAVTMVPVSTQAQAQALTKSVAAGSQTGSLAQLLNNGWVIQSASGQDGQYLILQFHGRKWARCELIMPSDPRLRYIVGVNSDCRALN
jgi:hypothetical protein